MTVPSYYIYIYIYTCIDRWKLLWRIVIKKKEMKYFKLDDRRWGRKKYLLKLSSLYKTKLSSAFYYISSNWFLSSQAQIIVGHNFIYFFWLIFHFYAFHTNIFIDFMFLNVNKSNFFSSSQAQIIVRHNFIHFFKGWFFHSYNTQFLLIYRYWT